MVWPFGTKEDDDGWEYYTTSDDENHDEYEYEIDKNNKEELTKKKEQQENQIPPSGSPQQQEQRQSTSSPPSSSSEDVHCAVEKQESQIEVEQQQQQQQQQDAPPTKDSDNQEESNKEPYHPEKVLETNASAISETNQKALTMVRGLQQEESIDVNKSVETDDDSLIESLAMDREEEDEPEDEPEEDDDDDEDDDDEEATSTLGEKQSLLALATEHDRVDILKAILSECSPLDRDSLLVGSGHTVLPPLHMAVSYGSTHATSCLLRMGANPAIRPQIYTEKKRGGSTNSQQQPHKYNGITAWELVFGVQKEEGGANQHSHSKDVATPTNDTLLPPPLQDGQQPDHKKGWFGGMFGSKTEEDGNGPEEGMADGATSTDNPATNKLPQAAAAAAIANFQPVQMAPSKKEGIRHAFTAEALRCIGADEVERLKQLLDSGMPRDIDIGGRTLHGWCIEMGARHCEPFIRPVSIDADADADNGVDTDNGVEKGSVPENAPANAQAEEHTSKDEFSLKNLLNDDDNDNIGGSGYNEKYNKTPMKRGTGSSESLNSLVNRLEELESLAAALSSCLDNLAEEVSVCHGLLLLGGGASALASHVRSLKAEQARREDDLADVARALEVAQDELAYWVREAKVNNVSVDTEGEDHFLLYHAASSSFANSSSSSSQKHSAPIANIGQMSAQEEESHRCQLLAQLAASENKVRKLRASITDLGEENTRDLNEVEKRGLTGGIKLVRTLREELSQVEFKLSEQKSSEGVCRATMTLIRSRLQVAKKEHTANAKSKEKGAKQLRGQAKEGLVQQQAPNQEHPANEAVSSSDPTKSLLDDAQLEEEDFLKDGDDDDYDSESVSDDDGRGVAVDATSKLIAAGVSNAIATRYPGVRGFTPLIIWDMVMRIVGLGRAAVKRSAENIYGSASSSVMIV